MGWWVSWETLCSRTPFHCHRWTPASARAASACCHPAVGLLGQPSPQQLHQTIFPPPHHPKVYQFVSLLLLLLLSATLMQGGDMSPAQNFETAKGRWGPKQLKIVNWIQLGRMALKLGYWRIKLIKELHSKAAFDNYGGLRWCVFGPFYQLSSHLLCTERG